MDRVREKADEISKRWEPQKRPFSLITGWSNNYDDILLGSYETTLPEDQILEKALITGRAILAGRGGDGKTWLLRRLYKRAWSMGAVPIFVDLKQWTGADYAEWGEWTRENLGDGADFLVRRFSGLGLGVIDIDRLPPEAPKIMLVDGLNEINAKAGLEILSVLDEVVASQINMSVLVADRLIRRDLPNPKRWRIGSPLPLTDEEVRKHLGNGIVLSVDNILRSPFFLNAALEAGASKDRRVTTLERLLRDHGGLSEGELLCVAKAAYDAYLQSRSRMFGSHAFVEAVGEPLATKLQDSGTLRLTDDGGFFQHHIVHDFLAAYYVARQESHDWAPAVFRALSFEASSFDAIELTFEQLERDRADLFLQKLYDWNLYAAGYALGQARQSDEPVGPEMRTVIYAMLAEKKFDTVLATSQRASDALRLMQLADAKPFREATSMGDVCAAVQPIDSEMQWFLDWKALFANTDNGQLSKDALELITHADSIIGWTIANVARRISNSEWMTSHLFDWLSGDANATVRWRIAHVLGSLPGGPVLQRLLQLLDSDDDEDVKYGSIRSIVELAALADPALRATVLTEVEQRAAILTASDRLSGELRSSLLIDPARAPEDWLEFVRGCVKSQFLQTDRLRVRDIWRGCLTRAEALYAPIPAEAGG